MREEHVRKMFARRPFTEAERLMMVEIYASAELLALRISKTVPECAESDLAIMQLKQVLAGCEAAVALHPREFNLSGLQPRHGDAQIGGNDACKQAETRIR